MIWGEIVVSSKLEQPTSLKSKGIDYIDFMRLINDNDYIYKTIESPASCWGECESADEIYWRFITAIFDDKADLLELEL
ncbi:hypothetical protein HI914_01066 [Erysiphe necator]|nr:hypothetical protein HI914_01066 [Erysiphe necator]